LNKEARENLIMLLQLLCVASAVALFSYLTLEYELSRGEELGFLAFFLFTAGVMGRFIRKLMED